MAVSTLAIPPLSKYFKKKIWHPNNNVFQVGDFYEAVGFDACILVEHAGLNPFGGLRTESIPRAGCPVVVSIWLLLSYFRWMVFIRSFQLIILFFQLNFCFHLNFLRHSRMVTSHFNAMVVNLWAIDKFRSLTRWLAFIIFNFYLHKWTWQIW